MEVEQQRRQGVANAAATVANATDAERVAEADALARAAADERGRAAAASRSSLAMAHTAAAQRRLHADGLAAEQALSRAAAESAAGDPESSNPSRRRRRS